MKIPDDPKDQERMLRRIREAGGAAQANLDKISQQIRDLATGPVLPIAPSFDIEKVEKEIRDHSVAAALDRKGIEEARDERDRQMLMLAQGESAANAQARNDGHRVLVLTALLVVLTVAILALTIALYLKP